MTVAGGANGQQTIDFYLSRSELLVARFSWSRHARELLQQWPEHFSIMPLVDDAMAGYRQVEDEVLRILLRHCGDALATMREGITRIGSISGHPAVFRLPGSDGDGEIAWQSFPESSALDSIEHVLTTDDPLANARKVPAARPAQTPGLRHADAQAAAVIATWLEHDSGADLTNVINRIVNEDQSVDPLIGGLVNLSVYQLRMLEIVLGVSPEALLGSFIADGSN
jgi:hypothetical protein